jgi:competence protein ComEC
MGLIAFYEAVSEWRRKQVQDFWPRGPVGRVAMWAMMAFLAMGATTLVASLFTALPAAYHFNRVSSLSLLANLLALPIVSAIVMPMALAAVVAMPLGLEAWPLGLMGIGIQWVADIAHWVAGLPGAAGVVPGMPAMAALGMAFGAAWLCLWRGRLRLVGLPLMAAGLALAPFDNRPDILVDRTVRNVAVRNAEGSLVPAERRRGRYAVENWLLEDGDGASLTQAAKRSGWACADKSCRSVVRGRRVLFLKEGADAAEACREADIVVAEFPLRRDCRDARLRIDRFDVWRHGAYAVFLRDGGLKVITADELRGQRPWVTRPVPRASIRDPAVQ